MKHSSYALLALTFVVVSVARAADDKPMETPYYPLKIGTAWNYKAGDIKVTAKVVKCEEIDNQLCARIESSAGGKVLAVEHVAVKEDGVYRYAYGNKKVEPPLLFLKLPPVKGQAWNVKSNTGTEKVSGTFTSGMIDEVAVPAGTFKDVYTCTGDCDANGVKVTFTYFFAKDVGMIKQTIKLAAQEITLELEKFEPGK